MKKNTIFTILVIIAALVLGYYLYSQGTETRFASVDSFEECVAAGYPILESYPEQCKTPDGQTFVRDITVPSPSPVVQQLSYNKAAFGIAFGYPNTYVLTEKEVGTAERSHVQLVLINRKDLPLPVNGEGPTAIVVDMYQNNIDKQTLDTWARNSSSSNFKLSKGTYATTTVDGLPAITYSWSGLYEGETTAFIHKNNIISVSVTYHAPTDQIRQDYQYILQSLQVSDATGIIPELL